VGVGVGVGVEVDGRRVLDLVLVMMVCGGQDYIELVNKSYPSALDREREKRYLQVRLHAAFLATCFGCCVGAVAALGPGLDAYDALALACVVGNG
jgi:hypothetical protein